MGKAPLRYVEGRKDRRGVVRYWYFVRRRQVWPLPGDPESAEFMAEYQRLKAATEPGTKTPIGSSPAGSYPRGTFGALVNDFLSSGQFRDKAERTRGEYRRIAELLQAEHGDNRVAKITRRHVRIIRDAKAETPGAANNVLRIMKILLNFAVDDGLMVASPAAKMRELKVGDWRAWTDKELATFEKRWAPGTMQRRAYAVALYTGQRKRDQVTRTRAHRETIDGVAGIWIVQSKTGEELWIPEHRELTAELARGVAGMEHLLITPTQGKAFGETYYGAWFADAIDKAGLPEDCVLHGLRKSAARKLADMGLSEEVIKSITGHVTSRMVAKYVRGANQRRLAAEGIRRWENEG
jgi:integrase